MPRACTVCTHAECPTIDQELADAIAYRAIAQHYGVQAALNARRQEQWGEQMHRLRVLLPKALDVLEQELEGENRMQAAVHVLKACKLYGTPMVVGSTEIEDIAIAAHTRLQQRESKAMLAGMRFNGRFS